MNPFKYKRPSEFKYTHAPGFRCPNCNATVKSIDCEACHWRMEDSLKIHYRKQVIEGGVK